MDEQIINIPAVTGTPPDRQPPEGPQQSEAENELFDKTTVAIIDDLKKRVAVLGSEVKKLQGL